MIGTKKRKQITFLLAVIACIVFISIWMPIRLEAYENYIPVVQNMGNSLEESELSTYRQIVGADVFNVTTKEYYDASSRRYLISTEKAQHRYDEIQASGRRSILPAGVMLEADDIAVMANTILVMLLLVFSQIFNRRTFFIVVLGAIVGILCMAIAYGLCRSLNVFAASDLNSFLSWQAYYWPNMSFGTYNMIHAVMTFVFSLSVALIGCSIASSGLRKSIKLVLLIASCFVSFVLIQMLFTYTFNFTNFSFAYMNQSVPYIELYTVAIILCVSIIVYVITFFRQRKTLTNNNKCDTPT